MDVKSEFSGDLDGVADAGTNRQYGGSKADGRRTKAVLGAFRKAHAA